PAALKRSLQHDAIFEIELSKPNGLTGEALEALPDVHRAVLTPTEEGAQLCLTLHAEAALAHVIQALTARNVRILRLSKREPTLEDVFVELVGRRMEEVEQEANGDGT
ncbi:MAG: DUF4162 domain-containing protein, partial [Thermanaerothrix sp.]|nr:DUF4162 domain-containing protein [Thermanaerothrix sp.]